MTFYRLFPKVPRRLARASRASAPLQPRVTVGLSGVAEVGLKDVEQMRSAMAASSEPLVCPECGGQLAVRGPVKLREGGHLAWMATCLQCEREEVRPVARRPRVARGELFDRLVESKRRGGRDVRGALGGMFVSAAFQTGVMVAAVIGTMGVVTQSAPALDTLMLTLTEVEPEAELQRDEADPLPLVTTLAPPPLGFQVLEAPIDIPTGIPPIDLDQRFDPRDYSGRGVEGGVFAGVEGGEGPVDQPEVFLAAAVEELPQQIYAPIPRYPKILRQSGIEGFVDVRYIVLSDGTVDPASIVVIESSHALFERAALRSLRAARFRPGRMSGVTVSVLVEQRITFSLL